MKKFKTSIWFDISLTIIILTISTLLGALLSYYNLHETNIVVLYIFSVVVISRITKGYVYGILSSVISLLLFNWFFTEPYYTFKVNDLTYIITFAIMTFTSIVTSALTTKVKQSAKEAMEKEAKSNTLYQMTNHLTDAEDEEAIAKIVVKTTSSILKCNSACICFDENGHPETTFFQSKDDGTIIRRKLDNAKELKQRIDNLHGNVDVTNDDYYYPIYGKSSILALISIPSDVGQQISESQNKILHSIIESVSMALERLRSLSQQAKSRQETAQERYRANLLRAISHDLRTPLSGIMGTSEIIMDKTDKNDSRYDLAKDIYKDAQWLHGLVENILNLTKLQDGKLLLKKKLEALEEVIGASLMVMEKRIPERNIDVDMPDNVVMVAMDAKLISQVIINLLDNAAKHTESQCEIKISVKTDKEYAYITVSDNGKGISKKDLPHIFQMFYTTNNKIADSKRGVGLGLAICQSIVEAHGGKIYAENKKEGGAAFTFTLPIGGEIND